MPAETFFSGTGDWVSVPISKLGLTVKGTVLEPVLAEFARELEQTGLARVRPVFYLSTEWGVPFGTVAIAIPFYLAHPELTRLQAERVGHVEGLGPADILRYLRHEMGHVVNYGYQLYDRPDWVEHFGSMDQPYDEEYHPEPFSTRFVRHLPGWYAQKHPDEDWAETFAVWMTPGLDWRAEYADWPAALAKLEYCERTMAELMTQDPVVTAADLDEDVSEISHSLDEFYGGAAGETPGEFAQGLDGALRAAFDLAGPGAERLPVAPLIRRLENDLLADVYRWTGHFPERTRVLVRHLARQADALGVTYPAGRDLQAAVALTTLVTALAMNHVRLGRYLA